MRTDLNRYEEKQIYLLKDGSFVFITDVDPLSSWNKTENSRRCYCKLGHKHKKDEQFKKTGQFIVVVENEPTKSVISIDVSKSVNYTIDELRNLEAFYVGKVTDEKMKDYNRIASEYANQQGW